MWPFSSWDSGICCMLRVNYKLIWFFACYLWCNNIWLDQYRTLYLSLKHIWYVKWTVLKENNSCFFPFANATIFLSRNPPQKCTATDLPAIQTTFIQAILYRAIGITWMFDSCLSISIVLYVLYALESVCYVPYSSRMFIAQ